MCQILLCIVFLNKILTLFCVLCSINSQLQEITFLLSGFFGSKMYLPVQTAMAWQSCSAYIRPSPHGAFSGRSVQNILLSWSVNHHAPVLNRTVVISQTIYNSPQKLCRRGLELRLNSLVFLFARSTNPEFIRPVTGVLYTETTRIILQICGGFLPHDHIYNPPCPASS